ncbi:Zn(II)2Cys6 transcription factor [Penicillium antarcticum]|uniref:Zn(II)2Cys6 transcription factor n=1 Tax=Penicillium antarcticum TaxID=416450 RepID=UPI0023A507B8|nr:Zn(II)2Cys6 transcription factor [Penicillium antarcticum]KAJ5300220.1 Zn(II)2Cys6 transcription factor [Penicillium antarcticum]
MEGAERTTQSEGSEEHNTSQNFEDLDEKDQDKSRRSALSVCDNHGWKRDESDHNPDQRSSSARARGTVTHPVVGSPILICAASISVPETDIKISAVTSDHDTQLMSQTQQVQQIDGSDPQLTNAPEREAQSQEPQTSHTEPPGVVSASLSPAPTEIAVQVMQKRRRVFSRRSKTGCMTCRRRKIKCDEQHPVCKNCIRGCLSCEGYMSQSICQRPSDPTAPGNLQSPAVRPDRNDQLLSETLQRCDRQSGLAMVVKSGNMGPDVVEGSERSAQQYGTSTISTGLGIGSRSTQDRPSDTAFFLEYMADPDHWQPPRIHKALHAGNPGSNRQVLPSTRQLFHETHSELNVPPF